MSACASTASSLSNTGSPRPEGTPSTSTRTMPPSVSPSPRTVRTNASHGSTAASHGAQYGRDAAPAMSSGVKAGAGIPPISNVQERTEIPCAASSARAMAPPATRRRFRGPRNAPRPGSRARRTWRHRSYPRAPDARPPPAARNRRSAGWCSRFGSRWAFPWSRLQKRRTATGQRPAPCAWSRPCRRRDAAGRVPSGAVPPRGRCPPGNRQRRRRAPAVGFPVGGQTKKTSESISAHECSFLRVTPAIKTRFVFGVQRRTPKRSMTFFASASAAARFPPFTDGAVPYYRYKFTLRTGTSVPSAKTSAQKDIC